MKVAVVGNGRWAQNHIRILSDKPNIKLTVLDLPFVCDMKCFDAVFITASSVAHYPLLAEAFRLRVPVYCEKPICLTKNQLYHLNSLFHTSQIFAGGFQLLYLPELVNRPSSELLSFSSVRTGAIPRDEGAILSLAVHDLSLLAHFSQLPFWDRISVSGDKHEAMILLSKSSSPQTYSASIFVSSFSRARARIVQAAFSSASPLLLRPDNWNRVDLLETAISAFLADAASGKRTKIIPTWCFSYDVMFTAFKIQEQLCPSPQIS
jgi:hypothetical protein